MTYTDPTSPLPAAHAPAWETCDRCQAPLAERQRYCVVCGTRRAHADDPAARYFVESARRARAAAQAPAAEAAVDPAASSRLRLALVYALLPVVAALGILVGRDSGSDGLVDALKAQKAPVVNVYGGGGGSGSAGARDTSGGTGSGAEGDASDPAKGKVIARTRYGSARSLTDSRVTPQQLEESRQALRHIVDSKGRAYVEQQRDLPDQIVIP